jgi:hypothetical protein
MLQISGIISRGRIKSGINAGIMMASVILIFSALAENYFRSGGPFN